MIIVTVNQNTPTHKYEGATKFRIDADSGNLHVRDSAGEDIAVHAHGTWSSVSVDNSKKYVDNLTPEMVSGEWPTVFDDSSTYDCSGAYFVDGITNFCAKTVADAISALRLPAHRENLTLLIDISLYNRFEDNYELNRKPDGTQWKRYSIQINSLDQDTSKPFLETLIRHTNGKTVKLITREF